MAPMQKGAQRPFPTDTRAKTACLRCKERKVKCDENRPRCDRCVRRHEECIYVNPHDVQHGRPSSSRAGAVSSSRRSTASSGPASPSHFDGQDLPDDIKFYLTHFQEKMTNYHYCIRVDVDKTLSKMLIRLALDKDNTALLYAVVAYSAYNYAFSRDDKENLQDFMIYYSKSFQDLSDWLGRGACNVPTLLTVLQLAIIEQNIGDWLNTMKHQRAAREMLLRLYTPTTVLEDPEGRIIVKWYMYFDLLASFLGGVDPLLGRTWYETNAQYYKRRLQDKSTVDRVGAQLDAFLAQTYLLAVEYTEIVADCKKPDVNLEELEIGADIMLEEVDNLSMQVETAFTEPEDYVQSFPRAGKPQPDDITDFRDPNFVHAADLFPMNFIRVYIWSFNTLVKGKICSVFPAKRPALWPAIIDISVRIRKMFEALQYCDEAPYGTFRCVAVSMFGTGMFLLEKKDIDWACRKHAMLQSLGVMSAIGFRDRLSALWGRDISAWWISDEVPRPLVSQIRRFAERRVKGGGLFETDESVDDMKGLFEDMNLKSEPEDSPVDYTVLPDGRS